MILPGRRDRQTEVYQEALAYLTNYLARIGQWSARGLYNHFRQIAQEANLPIPIVRQAYYDLVQANRIHRVSGRTHGTLWEWVE